jgi:hypothetical protein
LNRFWHSRTVAPICVNAGRVIVQTQSIEPSTSTQRWPFVLAAVWMAVVLFGLVMLWRYASTPAGESEPRLHWPPNSQISLGSDEPTLVMFVHPHCPCTRASIAELAKIAAHGVGQFKGWVVLYKPTESHENWEQTDLAQSAAAIPGMHVVADADGRLARLFRVTTSGHALLYDTAGDLLFSGGITVARGHAGDNLGEAAIVSLLTGGAAETSRTPVFGCPIVKGTP